MNEEEGHFLSFRHLKQSAWRTSAVPHINSRSIRAGFYNEAVRRITVLPEHVGWATAPTGPRGAQPDDKLSAVPTFIRRTACCCRGRAISKGTREFRDVTYPLVKQAGLKD
jgi:hypothetical protein